MFPTFSYISQIDTKFTKTLDAKLRRLQREEKHGKKTETNNDKNRKPFVTTVPKGTFLEAPQEIEKLYCKDGKIQKEEAETLRSKKKEARKLYAYSSQPRVLNRSPNKVVHVQKCTAAFAAAKIASAVAGMRNFEEKSQHIKKDQ